MERPDYLGERRMRRWGDHLDRNRQWPGQIQQWIDESNGPGRRCRRHQRNPDKRNQAGCRLGSPQRDVGIGYLARRAVLGYLDSAAHLAAPYGVIRRYEPAVATLEG